jgi:hypothetical protein
MKPTLSPAAQAELEHIAQTILHIATLETRKRDDLEFHEVSAGSLKEALEAAYLAGIVDHCKI